MSAAPPVTVMMPVYNGIRFLPESVGSILTQGFGDFELLVVDDASRDGSPDYLRGLGDPRVRIVSQETNQGIRRNYNRGLAEARGRYVAVMDQDDISEPGRLARQFRFMEDNPGIGLCGTGVTLFGDTAGPSWVRYQEPDDLRIALLFENPICHPSVMIRTAVLREHGLEYPDVPYAEEYALWIRIAAVSGIANLGEPLLRYRTHPGQVSRRRSLVQSASVRLLAEAQLDAMGARHTPRDLVIHSVLGTSFVPMPGLRGKLGRWTARLEEANRSSGTYPAARFGGQLAARRLAADERHRSMLAAMGARRRLQWLATGFIQYLGAGIGDGRRASRPRVT